MAYTKGSMPIGTIITSFLNWMQFQQAVGIAVWSDTSEWAPCDGRVAATSAYKTATGNINLPDLRGLFLRCLNSIDPANITAIPAGQKNADEPAFGTVQPSALLKHSHSYTGMFLQAQGGSGFSGHGFDSNSSPGPQNYDMSKTGQSDDETRPKNLSVFYYIKIN